LPLGAIHEGQLEETVMAPIKIVALGASNTEGYGVPPSASYPARLEALLAEHGIAAEIHNAGISGDTTSGMLARLDDEVAEGTTLVLFQPGMNDLHPSLLPRREANIAAIKSRLAARGIPVIMVDNDLLASLPQSERVWDGIHFTAKGYAFLAERVLPEVLKALGR